MYMQCDTQIKDNTSTLSGKVAAQASYNPKGKLDIELVGQLSVRELYRNDSALRVNTI